MLVEFFSIDVVLIIVLNLLKAVKLEKGKLL